MFHDSKLLYQLKVASIGVTNENGVSCMDPKAKALRMLGVFDPIDSSNVSRGYIFHQSLLIGFGGASGPFEVVSLFCKEEEFTVYLTGHVLGIFPCEGFPRFFAIYGSAHDRLWVFVCTNDLENGYYVKLAGVPKYPTLKSFPRIESCSVDAAAITLPKFQETKMGARPQRTLPKSVHTFD